MDAVSIKGSELLELAKDGGFLKITSAKFQSKDGLPMIGGPPKHEISQMAGAIAQALGVGLVQAFPPAVLVHEGNRSGDVVHEVFVFSAEQLLAYLQSVFALQKEKMDMLQAPAGGEG